MTGVIDINECSASSVAGKNIGIIGVGKMGLGIAISLIRNKANVIYCSNVSREGAAYIQALGAREVDSPSAVAEGCDVIILALPTSDDVFKVCLGTDGIILAKRRGQLIIDTSTGDPRRTATLAHALSVHGVDYIDAPLTRGPVEARQGRLNAILGSPERLVSKGCSILRAFCDFIIHVGDVGEAQKIKLLNNALSMGIVAITANTIELAQTLDARIDYLRILVSRGGVNNDLSQALLRWVSEECEKPLNFSINNALKDLNYLLPGLVL